jgi:hypothetical protein
MGKAIAATLVMLVFMDQFLNSGRYGDAVVSVLRQIRHSFG